MNIADAIVQLRDLAPIFAGNVAGAAGYANGVADQVYLPMPAAYVVPLSEDAGENDSMTSLQQLVTERIGVIVVLSNAFDPADRRGQAAAEQFVAVRAAIFRALLNWRPDYNPADPSTNRETRGLAYAGGEMIDFDRARLFYRWDFTLETTITNLDGWQEPAPPLVDVQVQLVDQLTGKNLPTFDAPLTT